MAKWKYYDAEYINLCFEYDWECSKAASFIKDNSMLINVKEFFRLRYKFILDIHSNLCLIYFIKFFCTFCVYKFYSGLMPDYDIWVFRYVFFE